MKVYRSDALIGSEKTIHIFSRDSDVENETHTHDFIEIIYVRAGEADQYIDGELYRVRRGDLLFLNYGTAHAFSPREDFSYVNICFNPEILASSVITPENAFAVLQLTAFGEIRKESDNGVVSFGVSEREEIEALLRAIDRKAHV